MDRSPTRGLASRATGADGRLAIFGDAISGNRCLRRARDRSQGTPWNPPRPKGRPSTSSRLPRASRLILQKVQRWSSSFMTGQRGQSADRRWRVSRVGRFLFRALFNSSSVERKDLASEATCTRLVCEEQRLSKDRELSRRGMGRCPASAQPIVEVPGELRQPTSVAVTQRALAGHSQRLRCSRSCQGRDLHLIPSQGRIP